MNNVFAHIATGSPPMSTGDMAEVLELCLHIKPLKKAIVVTDQISYDRLGQYISTKPETGAGGNPWGIMAGIPVKSYPTRDAAIIAAKTFHTCGYDIVLATVPGAGAP